MPNHAGPKSILSVAMAPALVDQSAANTLSAPIDMQGYDRVRFIYQLGGMVAGASLASWAVESNESNLGNSTNITGAALVNVANTANNSVQVLDIHRPAKRYVGVTVDAAAANITLLGIIAERFRGSGGQPIQVAGAQYVSVQAN